MQTMSEKERERKNNNQGFQEKKLNYASTTFSNPYILYKYHAFLLLTLGSNDSLLRNKIYPFKHNLHLCYSESCLYCKIQPKQLVLQKHFLLEVAERNHVIF